jgi:hypothetical protein
MVKWRPAAFSTVILLAAAARLWGGGPPSAAMAISPEKTTVLLLPALDLTPDAAHMLPAREAVIRHREEFELISRRFNVLGDAAAEKAAGLTPRIDLGGIAVRNADNLDLLAKRAGANWVASVAVREVKMDSFEGGQFRIHSSVLYQLWDSANHRWLVNDTIRGEVAEGGSPAFAFKDSLDNAIKNALGTVAGAFPETVSVPNEYGVNDYLAGQSAPPSINLNTPSNR